MGLVHYSSDGTGWDKSLLFREKDFQDIVQLVQGNEIDLNSVEKACPTAVERTGDEAVGSC
jgi:hypothetical protein